MTTRAFLIVLFLLVPVAISEYLGYNSYEYVEKHGSAKAMFAASIAVIGSIYSYFGPLPKWIFFLDKK